MMMAGQLLQRLTSIVRLYNMKDPPGPQVKALMKATRDRDKDINAGPEEAQI
jgi:hypothetical protein